MTSIVQEGHNRDVYEWKSGSVTEAGSTATVNLNTKSGFTTLFNTIEQGRYVKIEVSGTAYFRLNTVASDVITATATSPITFENFSITNIFVSTGGAAITITVTLL